MMDDKAQEVKADQAEIDHRSEVEQRAEALICQCRFKEAMELLDALKNPAAPTAGESR